MRLLQRRLCISLICTVFSLLAPLDVYSGELRAKQAERNGFKKNDKIFDRYRCFVYSFKYYFFFDSLKCVLVLADSLNFPLIVERQEKANNQKGKGQVVMKMT